ncbi:MAG TPA: ATP-binding protein [Jiangellales bacterium]|nr:ATP-binding protein [Jiangellales bacterium]
MDAEDLPEACVVADDEGRVAVLNAPAARLLGVHAADVVGKHLRDVVPLVDQDGQDWFAAADPYGGLSTRRVLVERVMSLPDGREVAVGARIVRPAGPLGPVSRVVVLLRGAEDRIRTERRRADLLATAAHELRGPLAGVQGFSSTLLAAWDRLSDPQRLMLVESVAADAQRLGRLVSTLLDVAHIDSGRLRPKLTTVDLVQHARQQVRRAVAAGEPADRLVVEVRGRPGPVAADPDRVDQVLANLLDNALRHGGGTVTVSVERAGDEVVVRVADEGPGIPESLRSRATTRFWRAGGSSGSGLGLCLVHGIVRAHGGSLELGAAPGGGALVTARFPTEGRTGPPSTVAAS